MSAYRSRSNSLNTLRRSAAPDDIALLNNYPGRYLTEDWTAHYWTVTEQGKLAQRQVMVQLPRGFSEACTPVTVGYAGCVRTVRRWGFGCYPEILNEISFDFSPLLSNAENDAEWLAAYFDVVTFDLPGYFVIAGPDHPFLLYDPAGVLKGSYAAWRTYLGALSYMVGELDASFVELWQEDDALYRQALAYLQQALEALQRGD